MPSHATIKSTSPRPLSRTRLPDDLAERLQQRIQADYAPGDRLPSIAALAREFGVGAPTVREALKRLEMAGAVAIRHGSGVYVGRRNMALLVGNPVITGAPSKQQLLDLIEARAALEVRGVERAALAATDAQLDEMEALLEEAAANLADDELLNQTNMAFHRSIAVASGNSVLAQLLDVLTSLFTREQRAILDIQNSRADDHQQHVEIYHALRRRDAITAGALMAAHLAKVHADLERWDPIEHPLSMMRDVQRPISSSTSSRS